MSPSIFASLAAVALSVANASSNPTMAQPSGPWRVEQGDASCALSRSFVSGGSATSLIFNKRFEAYKVDVILLTELVGLGQARSGKAKLKLLPSNENITADYAGAAYKDGRQLTRISVTRADWSRLATAAEIQIKAPPVVVDLQWSQFSAAQAALEKCEGELKEGWSVASEVIPPDRHAKIIGNPGALFGPSAYPAAALKAKVEGEVTLILVVGDDGKVAGCRVAASVSSLLNVETCTAARMVRFEPARNSAGTRVRSVYPMVVHWRLPE